MDRILQIGQSADPDDAFMAWALNDLLAEAGIPAEVRFDDIESLNRAAAEGKLAMTAISVGLYPRIADRYRMLRTGASFGDAYGPMVVGRSAPAAAGPEAIAGLRVAIPGNNTTAAMLLRIYAGNIFDEVVVPFDEILDAVQRGDVDAGLIIHEGQLVYERLGLHALFEPALMWAEREQLPLPLGAVAVRRDLEPELQARLADLFARSIHRGFENLDQALDFAADFSRGLDRPTLEEYVHRYVNASTLDMGAAGARSIQRLFDLATGAGLLPSPPTVDLL
jgi:1,4-dihydroxy-6-naphthoate synthase